MKRLRFSVCLGVVVMLIASPGFSDVPTSSGSTDPSPADRFSQQGYQLYQRGTFDQAVERFRQAAEGYAQESKPLQQSDALLGAAQAYLALGHHMKAAQSLELGLAITQGIADRGRLASLMGALAQVYLEAGQGDATASYLEEALRLAKEPEDPARLAVILNTLGKFKAAQEQFSEALEAFSGSQFHAQAARLPVVAVFAMINAGKAALQVGKFSEAQTWFHEALRRVRRLPDSHDKSYGLLSLGLGFDELRHSLPEHNDRLLLLAAQVLEEGGEVAQALGDARGSSYAFGFRGRLYEEAGRYQEALLLTRLAVSSAQQVQAPESLYRWQWQTGRLLKALGQLDEALAAYRRASEAVQSIRPELAAGSGGMAVPFRESGGQLFFELADVLLQRASLAPDQKQARPYLVEARESVERFKAAELRDYFQDECVDALRSHETKLEDVSQHTAVVYPIVLPDRTELLVSLPSGLSRFSVPVPGDQLRKEVEAFRHFLEKRTTRQYVPHGQRLYEWLIKPFESKLGEFAIKTLVFVPDGPLRTIPMAALYDGEHFLIEKYAVATTPGLNLTDPKPLSRDRVKVLAAGLTTGVQGFPPMPYVVTELTALEELYHRPPLLNQEFISSAFEKELQQEEFTVVHVASHAKFESQAERSFLLTYNDRLTMDQLRRVVGLFRFREEPLELLTLSACETAAGDDRAALGLAGVAIKAGARSALASLWFINDEASSALVAEFYRQLQDPSATKAVALQRAQLTLLRNPAYQHPSFWAPFLLLNNWL